MSTAAMDRALKLAVATGLRAALGPALVARARNRPDRQHFALAAMGELAFDKFPYAPGRDTLLPTLARGAAGGWAAGQLIEEEGASEPWAVPLGAAVAMGVAVAAPKIRRMLAWTFGIPQPVLGLAEDYLALRLGAGAVGLSLGEVADAARESVGALSEKYGVELPEPARAWLAPITHALSPTPSQSAGAGSM